MNQDIQQLWQEIISDLSSPQALWQIAIVFGALAIAWLLHFHLQHQVARGHVHPLYKLLMGGFDRLFIPFTAFVLTTLARYSLDALMHVSLLRLASRLLIALVIIRLIVYSLRYVFSPSKWLSGFERIITWTLWGLVALQLTGYLKAIIQLLADIKFSLGKQELNLWLLLQGGIIVIVTILSALWVSRIIENKVMKAESLSANWRAILVKLIRILAVFVAVLIALSAVGLDLTMLSVFSGALGVGLGFGLQKIASNYVSGFIILMDKSMHIGDIVSVDKHAGVIKELRSRYMVLDKLDGTSVIIPNEILITNAVINHSLQFDHMRTHITFTVSYDADLEALKKVALAASKKQERVLAEPAPSFTIKRFVEEGIECELAVSVKEPQKGVGSIKSALYWEVWQASKQLNLVFAKHEKSPE